MTVASTTRRNDYTGTAAVSTYAYSFKVFVEASISVVVADTDGNETTLVLTTDFTLTGVGETAGGNVVLVNASQDWLTGGFLKTGYTITIRRIRELKQNTDIRNQGSYFPETHEDEFDKQIMIDQQQQDELDRSLKIAITDTGIDATLPAASADAYIGWNADGDGFANKTPTSLSDSGPNINSGDAAKIVNVNDAENAYQLSTFKALLEAIVSGGLTVNTALTAASTFAVTGATTLAGTLAANAALTMGSIFKFKKGADVASAGALTLGDDGNVFDITGTTGITSITAKTAGTVVMLQFDGALTITDGSNLKIRGDFITAAESTIMLYCDGTSWFEISRSIEADDLAKSGIIDAWSGAISAIPSGYVICDGNNSTPDLTDKFIIHADADAAGTNDVGDTGGASTHGLSTAELAAHTHTQDDFQGGGTTGNGGNSNINLLGKNTGSTGSGTAHTNRDKFHALAFIMKT